MADKAPETAPEATLVYLKPGDGRRVRKPDGSVLPDAGEGVEPSQYWDRRLLDEDVVEFTPPKAAKESAPK